MEFLIDNCFEIFGENIPTHSRITSDDSLEHTDSSGTEHSVTDCASGEKPMPVLNAGMKSIPGIRSRICLHKSEVCKKVVNHGGLALKFTSSRRTLSHQSGTFSFLF